MRAAQPLESPLGESTIFPIFEDKVQIGQTKIRSSGKSHKNDRTNIVSKNFRDPLRDPLNSFKKL